MMNCNKHLTPIALLLTIAFGTTFTLCAAEPAPKLTNGSPNDTASTLPKLEPFLDQYCVDCHDSDTQKGDLNLFDLPFTPHDESNRTLWVRVFDRVRSGEMPPKKKARPDESDRRAFMTHLGQPLGTLIQHEQDLLGRVRSRRLNRIEYENTMHDLLGIDIPLQDFLPEDTYHDGFATVAEAQQVSHFLLEKYLAGADASLDEAFGRVLNPSKPYAHHFTSEELGRRSGQRDPWHVGDETIAWSSTQVYHGRVPETEVRRTGWYRITLHDIHAVNAESGQSVWCTVRSGICYAKAPIMYPVGVIRADETKRDHSFVAWVRRGHMIEARPMDRTIPNMGGTSLNNYRGSTRDKRPMPKVPGLAYSGITIESVHLAPPQNEVHRLLFGDLPLNNSGPTGVRTSNPRQDAFKLMRAFASRAFRRPVTRKEVEPYFALVSDDLSAGLSFTDALKGGYRALLCSPRFLYFNENPGRLDDHAIATRLSYFLWSSTPDATLLRAADAGELSDPKALRRQVERMLAHPRAKGLVTALADQWLNLREIDFTAPDSRLYREFDETLKQSMIQETHAFLGKLIDEDLPTANIIHSDFAMLNERLAKHYNIPGVHHQDIRPVVLKPEYHRGGVLTQGAFLKVTANGTTTSPVVRGAFVNERILGVTVPPPPDNVPAIEPDIRGAISIRDQLDKHRDSTSCAACHIKIDPPGFALESYDVIGGWRTHYRASRGVDGARVDPHYDLPDGPSFKNIDGFKQLVLQDKRQIARNVTHKFLTYSTGAPVSFADRAEVETILDQTRSSDYGMRSLIHAVVASPIFLSK